MLRPYLSRPLHALTVTVTYADQRRNQRAERKLARRRLSRRVYDGLGHHRFESHVEVEKKLQEKAQVTVVSTSSPLPFHRATGAYPIVLANGTTRLYLDILDII